MNIINTSMILLNYIMNTNISYIFNAHKIFNHQTQLQEIAFKGSKAIVSSKKNLLREI